MTTARTTAALPAAVTVTRKRPFRPRRAESPRLIQTCRLRPDFMRDTRAWMRTCQAPRAGRTRPLTVRTLVAEIPALALILGLPWCTAFAETAIKMRSAPSEAPGSAFHSRAVIISVRRSPMRPAFDQEIRASLVEDRPAGHSSEDRGRTATREPGIATEAADQADARARPVGSGRRQHPRPPAHGLPRTLQGVALGLVTRSRHRTADNRAWDVALCLLGILALSASASSGAALASSIGWCSQTGDTCLSTSEENGVRYVSLGAPEKYANRAAICIASPGGRRDCRSGRVKRFRSFYRVKLRWAARFPNRGPGRYRIIGPPEYENVAFEVGTGFELCAPVPDTETPGFASEVRVARIPCALARKFIPRVEEHERRTRQCAEMPQCRENRTVTVQGFRCRFGPIVERSATQPVRCRRARKRVNWRINFP